MNFIIKDQIPTNQHYIPSFEISVDPDHLAPTL